MKKKVFVLGSINQDISIEAKNFPQEGETVNGEGFKMSLGGKGANQSIALLKAGADVSLLGKVGKDEFGKSIVKTLSDYGLPIDSISISDSYNTGIAIIVLHNNNNRIILSHGANYDLKEKDVISFLKQANAGDYFLSQYENEPETTAFAFKKAKEKGLITVWNPSPIADYPNDLLSYIDILVLNETEGKEILEKEGKGDLQELGVSRIVLTLGDKGSISYSKKEVIRVPAKKIEPIDTTGAGDTFLGFFLASLSNGKEAKESLEIATKASALACLKRGASEAIPLLEDIR